MGTWSDARALSRNKLCQLIHEWSSEDMKQLLGDQLFE